MLSLLRRNSNLISVRYHLRHVTTSSAMDPSIVFLKSLFMDAVDSVKPKALFNSYLRDESILQQLQIPNKNYHLVGFGKAVLGMAVQMERILGDRLAGGCFSIPVGTMQRFAGDPDFQLSDANKLRIVECAANNLPDDAAVDAAKTILSLASKMSSEDVLCVLVSGGGSALLPLPRNPVTLAEKLTVIKMLAGAGASIDELNIVRIRLSSVKGGQLAKAAKGSCKVMSFIISDIIGDPVPLIASGPTVKSSVTNRDALEILEKYKLVDRVSEAVCRVLGSEDVEDAKEISGEIHLIGSNEIAIGSIVRNSSSRNSNIQVIPMSKSVQGNVSELSQAYHKLALSIVQFSKGVIQKSEFAEEMTKLFPILHFDSSKLQQLTEILSTEHKKDLILVSGGEPTVIIQGAGRGGRNQELALRFAKECSGDPLLSDVLLLSAGTDGIDGPTDAAGAIGGAAILERWRDGGRSVQEFIDSNDSYNFFRALEDGKFHIITGHTGTNVMDIQMLYIPKDAL